MHPEDRLKDYCTRNGWGESKLQFLLKVMKQAVKREAGECARIAEKKAKSYETEMDVAEDVLVMRDLRMMRYASLSIADSLKEREKGDQDAPHSA